MSYINKSLIQKAVYWPMGSEESGGVDTDAYGRPKWGTAYEIWCRWEDKSIEYIDASATRRLSMAVVYTKTDVRVGGVLWLGLLTAVTSLTVPKTNANAFEIFRFDKSFDLRGKEPTRKAYL